MRPCHSLQYNKEPVTADVEYLKLAGWLNQKPLAQFEVNFCDPHNANHH